MSFLLLVHFKLIIVLILLIPLDAYVTINATDENELTFENNLFDKLARLRATTTFKPINRPLSYCNWLQFVNRSLWEASEPDNEIAMMKLPLDKIFIDYTYSDRCSSLYLCSFVLKSTQAYHKKEIGLFDIAYNFMIGDDGKVYIGRDFTQSRAFDNDYNDNSLLIGIIGDYDDPFGALPRSLDIIYKLIRCGQEKGMITENITIYEPVVDHCLKGPGKRFYNFKFSDRKRLVHYRCLKEDRKYSTEVLRNGLRIFSAEFQNNLPNNNSI